MSDGNVMKAGIENPGQQSETGEVLWEQFLNGDLEACERLFRLYYRDLYGYGLKLYPNEEFVKDAIQELFGGLWEQRETLSQVISAKGYLLVSLRRMILRSVKKHRKYSSYEAQQPNQVPDIRFSAEEMMINK